MTKYILSILFIFTSITYAGDIAKTAAGTSPIELGTEVGNVKNKRQ